MADETLQIQLAVPDQDLDQLSFCESNPAKITEWVKQLPLANLGETSKKLYIALPEISRLRIPPKDRFAMLEALRPCAVKTINDLAHHFLNHPIILQPHELKIASLAQTLQKHLTVGYKQVVKQYSGLGKLDKEDRSIILPTAIERAITASGTTLLRCFQLYIPAPKLLWFELHQLYLFAEEKSLLDTSVENSGNKYRRHLTLLDAYLRTVLMGTIKPNQLNQIDLKQTFQVLESWVSLCALNHKPQDNLFVIQLADDKPPIYTTQSTDISNESNRHINTSQLVDQLQQATQNSRRSTMSLPVPEGVSLSLMEHLITTWSVQLKRSSDRLDSNHHLTICVGLRDFHYFASDKMPFDAFAPQKGQGLTLEGDSQAMPVSADNKLFGQQGDTWGSVFTANHTSLNEDIAFTSVDTENQLRETKIKKEEDSHHTNEVHVINTSPGGFCLEWDKTIPHQVRTGEIIGIQEKGNLNWSIGIIRWIRQIGEQRSQIGIESLSPTIIPYAVTRIVTKGPDKMYARALVLPELKTINQAATLITPHMSFQEGHKLKLNQHGSEQTILLSKEILTTSNVCQFEFRVLGNITDLQKREAGNNVDSQNMKDDNFGSIWDKL